MDSFSSLIQQLENKEQRIIFKYGQKNITATEFLSAVKKLGKTIASSPFKSWVLCYEDSYLFTLALFATWYASAHPILLPNNKHGTIRQFSSEYDAILTDISDIEQTFLDVSTDAEKPISLAKAASLKITLFTSGSTGEPKKITRSLEHIINEIEVLETTFANQVSGTVVYSTVPHQHTYGLTFYILWPLFAGRPIHTPILQYPENVAAIIETTKAMTLVSSPALLKRMPDTKIETKKLTIISAGSLLTQNVAEKLEQTMGTHPIEILGSTETGAIAYREQLLKSAWTPLLGVSVTAEPKTQALLVHSPFFDEKEGFLMGDTIKLEENGRFQLLGRNDRIVKIEEKRVSLAEIERILKQQENIEDAYALAREHHRQYVAVVIKLTTSGQAILKRRGRMFLNREFNEILSHYFELIVVPKKYRYVDEIPTNSMGKHIVSEINALFDKVIKPIADKTKSVKTMKYPNVIGVERSLENQSLVLQLFIAKEIKYFSGHFPNTPIVAGVVQVDWAIEFASRHFNLQKKDVHKIDQLKFTNLILPDTKVTLEMDFSNDTLTFKYFVGNIVFSKGKIKVSVKTG